MFSYQNYRQVGREMNVLACIRKKRIGDYTVSVMGSKSHPKYLHFDNHKTKNDSVIIKLSELKDFLSSVSCNQK